MLPWKETSAESERMRFIELKATGVETVADLCRWFGISRKTAYKLIGRYEAHGRAGLRDRSRLPIAMPTPLPEMWLSALSRRNAPIPRGAPGSLWPGCVPESRT